MRSPFSQQLYDSRLSCTLQITQIKSKFVFDQTVVADGWPSVSLGFEVEGLDARHQLCFFFEIDAQDVFGDLTDLTVNRSGDLKLHHLLEILQQRVVNIL